MCVIDKKLATTDITSQEGRRHWQVHLNCTLSVTSIRISVVKITPDLCNRSDLLGSLGDRRIDRIGFAEVVIPFLTFSSLKVLLRDRKALSKRIHSLRNAPFSWSLGDRAPWLWQCELKPVYWDRSIVFTIKVLCVAVKRKRTQTLAWIYILQKIAILTIRMHLVGPFHHLNLFTQCSLTT